MSRHFGFQSPNYYDQFGGRVGRKPITPEERERIRQLEANSLSSRAGALVDTVSEGAESLYNRGKGALTDAVDSAQDIYNQGKGALTDYVNRTRENIRSGNIPQVYGTGVPGMGTGTLPPPPPAPDPVLNTNTSTPDPALSMTNQASVATPVQATPAAVTSQVEKQTDNKRNRTSFAEYLMSKNNMQPGSVPLSERLIRLGGAMQGASGQGLNAAMAAFGQEYGNIADQNRAGLAAYQGSQAEGADLLNNFAEQQSKYQNALNKFQEYGMSGVTGIYDGTVGSFLDSQDVPLFGKPDREAFRVQLRKIVVDETLLNTANTKGAISDKEMALFQSSVPSLSDSEAVWVAWLTDRMSNLQEIQYRLANGITVPKGAGVGFATGSNAQQNSAPVQSAFSQDELDDIEEQTKGL